MCMVVLSKLCWRESTASGWDKAPDNDRQTAMVIVRESAMNTDQRLDKASPVR